MRALAPPRALCQSVHLSFIITALVVVLLVVRELDDATARASCRYQRVAKVHGARLDVAKGVVGFHFAMRCILQLQQLGNRGGMTLLANALRRELATIACERERSYFERAGVLGQIQRNVARDRESLLVDLDAAHLVPNC